MSKILQLGFLVTSLSMILEHSKLQLESSVSQMDLPVLHYIHHLFVALFLDLDCNNIKLNDFTINIFL